MDWARHARTVIILLFVLVFMTSSGVHSAFLNQSFSKSMYPDGTYIITTMPMASFPSDHRYCYIGQNNFDVQVIYHNYNGSSMILDNIEDELSKADISINWDVRNIQDEQSVYFDFEFEVLMNGYRQDSDSDYVLVFTDMQTPDDGAYYNLGGYARLQNHFGIVFTPKMVTQSHVSAIGLHELCHLLGYWHSENPDDVMYPQFTGSNTGLTTETIDILYELHH